MPVSVGLGELSVFFRDLLDVEVKGACASLHSPSRVRGQARAKARRRSEREQTNTRRRSLPRVFRVPSRVNSLVEEPRGHVLVGFCALLRGFPRRATDKSAEDFRRAAGPINWPRFGRWEAERHSSLANLAPAGSCFPSRRISALLFAERRLLGCLDRQRDLSLAPSRGLDFWIVDPGGHPGVCTVALKRYDKFRLIACAHR